MSTIIHEQRVPTEKPLGNPSRYWSVPLTCFIGLAFVIGLLLYIPSTRGYMQAWHDHAQSVESMFGVAALLVAALWAFVTNREQRANELAQEIRELEWQRIKAAKDINDEMMLDKEAMAAMNMIDDEFATLELGKAGAREISPAMVLSALQVPEDPAVAKDADLRTIRRCIDSWIYYLILMQHYVHLGLIERNDVGYPSSYYIRRLRAATPIYRALLAYIRHYGLGDQAVKFIEGFENAPAPRRRVTSMQ